VLLTDVMLAPAVDSVGVESSEEVPFSEGVDDELSKPVDSGSSSVKTGIELVEVDVSVQSDSSIVNIAIEGIGVEASDSCEERLVDDASDEVLRVTISINRN
jgi:hypothetical protein